MHVQPVTLSIEQQDYYRFSTASIRFRLNCDFVGPPAGPSLKALTLQRTAKVERGLAGGRVQPEGLPDSSRWSKRSADHRNTVKISRAPRRGARLLAPLRGANHLALASGGLRFASTSGYFLATLRVATTLATLRVATDDSPSGPLNRCQNCWIAPRDNFINTPNEPITRKAR